MNYLPMVVLCMFGCAILVSNGGAQAQRPPRRPPVEQPVDPGVPIGCLLKPGCGGNLFVHPDGKFVTPHAPVNPAVGLPCLLNPQCNSQLDAGGRAALFQRPVSPDDVAHNGATIGDYIPFRPAASAPPRSLNAVPQMDVTRSRCTASIIGARESANAAQKEVGRAQEQRTAVDIVVGAYSMALADCSPLRR
jgi:hypothetical protein